MTEHTETKKAERPRRLLALGAVLLLVAMGAGYWFATQFQSPAQQEADAKAPVANPVFAEVVRGSLVDEATFNGRVGPLIQTPVTVLPAPDASLAVVTGRPLKAGASVSSGQVLTEVNGRPLFGVQSPFSFYRDMFVGDHGPDVEALQIALAARDYPVAVDGRFGAETAAAIERWYADDGYEVPRGAGIPVEDIPREERSEAPEDSAPETQVQEPYVPLTEILALSANSVEVVRGLRVGQRLAVEGEPDFILGSPDLVVTVTVPVAELRDVVAGAAAVISIDDVTVKGVVGDIRTPGSTIPGEGTDESPEGAPEQEGVLDEADGTTEVTFAVLPATPLPVRAGRAGVTVTRAIIADDALIVPILAVSDRGADRTFLAKRRSDGSLIEVRVAVLDTLHGEVAVKPVEVGALKVGDQVRVG